MSRNADPVTLMITLRSSTLASLMSRVGPDAPSLGAVIDRLVTKAAQTNPVVPTPAVKVDGGNHRRTVGSDLATMPEKINRSGGFRYHVEVLGATVSADTLGDLFARVVDLVHGNDPDAIDRLAEVTVRRRRFVARNRDAIHPGRPDLPVIRSRSGWWVSSNVSRADLLRALNALATANGLVHGRDISPVR